MNACCIKKEELSTRIMSFALIAIFLLPLVCTEEASHIARHKGQEYVNAPSNGHFTGNIKSSKNHNRRDVNDILTLTRRIISDGSSPAENKHPRQTVPASSQVLTKLLLSEKGGLDSPTSKTGSKYDPTWDSIDSRPLPQWFDEAKIGIFLHWGVFSVPSITSEWFWTHLHRPNSSDSAFMRKNYKPGFTYQEFAPEFTAEFFDPDLWADILASSGAKYVVLTSKHHEGYTLWPSSVAFSWNSMDVGPKRDLVGDLAASIRKKYKDIRFGLYHSLFEWYNPLYLMDKANNFSSNYFVVTKTMPELFEIVLKYKPEVIWSDGEWEAPVEYWKSREFLAWLYNESPVKDTVVVNDRWCNTCLCQHGGYLTCEDRYNPGTFQARKFENAFTIDKTSWGFRRNAPLCDYMNITEIISTVMDTLSVGGNALINVGPTKEGTISPIFQERLKDLGGFLKVNGEAIYSSNPWKLCQNETANNVTYVWYTTSKPADDDPHEVNLFATFVSWPKNDQLYLSCVKTSKEMSVYLLGYDEKPYSPPLKWEKNEKGITVYLPKKSLTSYFWAWTLKTTISI